MPHHGRLACERLEDRSVPAFLTGDAASLTCVIPSPLGGLASTFSPGPLVLDLNRDGRLDLVSRDLQGRVLLRPGLEEGRFGAPQTIGPRAALLASWEGQLLGWDGQTAWQWSPEGATPLNLNGWKLALPDASPLAIQGPDWTAVLDIDRQTLEVTRGEQRFVLEVGPDANGLIWCPLGLLLSNRLGDVWRIELGEKGPSWGPMLSALPEAQAGDLDADELVDYVYRSLFDQEVWVHLKSGQSYSLDTKTRSGCLTLADLDRDGLLDLIVCDEIGSQLLLYRGQGNGRFAPEWNQGQALSVPTPRFATAVELSQGAGMDVLVVSTQSDQVHLLWSQPATESYGLVLGPSLPAGIRPTAAAVLDWTGDEQPDLLVTSSGSNELVILPGQGQGRFESSQPRRIAVGANPQQLLVGDFRGQGRADVVTLNTGGNSLTLVPHGGDSTDVREIVTGVSSPYRALAQDANADGRLDLMVEHLWQNTLVLMRGEALGWTVATMLVGGPTTSESDFSPSMSRLWDTPFVSLWPAELVPPSTGDPGTRPEADRPSVEFQPVGTGAVSLLPIWLGEIWSAPAQASTTVLPVGGTLGEDETEILRLPGARANEAVLPETPPEPVPPERVPLLGLLPGHEDSPPPELAPDGSTDPQTAPAILLPPALGTPTAAEKAARPETVVLWEPRQPLPPPREEPQEPGEQPRAVEVGVGTTGLLLAWWWKPRSRRPQRTRPPGLSPIPE
jgi:hypothetical protein